MANTLTSAGLTVTPNYTLTLGGSGGTATDRFTDSLNSSLSYAVGTGSGQVDVAWSATITLASSASTTLDLTALAAIDGGTRSFAKVKVLVIENQATTAGYDLTVGNAAAPFNPGLSAAANTWTVPAGSVSVRENRYSGWAVTDTTADQLKITNSGAGSITARVLILGTSA